MDNYWLLDETEKNIILHHRKKQERIKQEKQQRLKLLKTAYEFEKWLQENEAGVSYSAFCNDFGYEADPDENRSRIYETILHIRNMVMDLINDK